MRDDHSGCPWWHAEIQSVIDELETYAKDDDPAVTSGELATLAINRLRSIMSEHN